MVAKVLLVEDHLETQERLRVGLENKGFDVCFTPLGRKAVELCNSFEPDVVVLDYVLEDGFNGDAVLRTLRQAGNQVSVIFLTQERTSEKDIMQAFDLGADDYLIKPYSLDLLERRIKALLRRGKGGSSTPSGGVLSSEVEISKNNVFKLEVDLNNQRVFLNSKEINLGGIQQFRVLIYLMRNPDRIISREEIQKAVLQMPAYEPTSNIDPNIIHRIRKALSDFNGDIWIETIPRMGYRFLRSVESK